MSSKSQNRKEFFRPVDKYKKLTKDVFPKSLKTVDVPNGELSQKSLSKLVTFYSTSPDKVDKIGQYILRRIKKEYVRRRHFAELGFELCSELLKRCPSNARLFSEAACAVVEVGLGYPEQHLKLAAVKTFISLAQILRDPSTNDVLLRFYSTLLSLSATPAADEGALKVRAEALRACSVLYEVRSGLPADGLDTAVRSCLSNLFGGVKVPEVAGVAPARPDKQRRSTVAERPHPPPSSSSSSPPLVWMKADDVMSGRGLPEHVSAARRCWLSLSKVTTMSNIRLVLSSAFVTARETGAWRQGEGTLLAPALLLLSDACPLDGSIVLSELGAYAMQSGASSPSTLQERKTTAYILHAFIRRADASLSPSMLRSLVSAFDLIPTTSSAEAEEVAGLIASSIVDLLRRLSGQPQHLDVLARLAEYVRGTSSSPKAGMELRRNWALDCLMKGSEQSKEDVLGKSLGHRLIVPLAYLLEDEEGRTSEIAADVMGALLHRPHSQSFHFDAFTPSSRSNVGEGITQGLGGYGILSRQLRLLLYSSMYRVVSAKREAGRVLSHVFCFSSQLISLFGASDQLVFASLFATLLKNAGKAETEAGKKRQQAFALAGIHHLFQKLEVGEEVRARVEASIGGEGNARSAMSVLGVVGVDGRIELDEGEAETSVSVDKVDASAVSAVVLEGIERGEGRGGEDPLEFFPIPLPSEDGMHSPFRRLPRRTDKAGGEEKGAVGEGGSASSQLEAGVSEAQATHAHLLSTPQQKRAELDELLSLHDSKQKGGKNKALDDALSAFQL
mmetsp:Transcript_5868/g.13907  ORF Transcript_5868/g.13907 Transcript_5868/m.13907 type:complete len:788 (-) Transcript_5868:228-2591(-)